MPHTSSLPQLNETSEAGEPYRRFADGLRQSGFAGDIQLDFSSRTVQSTDNSIYQRFPQGVLYPANTEDLIRIAKLGHTAPFRTLTFCARGGGTGANGQALDEGFVVDVSRYMNGILEINVEERWARVQAGVVKDQLNAATREHGLFFAPDTSTSNRATIGGMINTDASGQGSCRYGKTRDHVLALDAVLMNGHHYTCRAMDAETLAGIRERDDGIGSIYRLVDDIEREHRGLIQDTYPPLNRGLSGYNLAHVRTADGGVDMNSVLCGSEGSLAFIAEAVVKLELLPRCTALVVVQYSDFVAALRDSRTLMQVRPTAVETVDDTIVDLARTDAIWPKVSAFFPTTRNESLAAANFVEIAADSETQLSATLDSLNELLNTKTGNSHRLGFTSTTDSAAINTLWTMRKRAVGLLGNMPGLERPVPFVEDTAVPPESLADYIAEFRRILDERRLRYGMFGHADAGVIHVRPALNMRDPDSIRTVRSITDQVFQLTRRYGGLLWGEHGKGLRSEYSPATFGDLYPQLQRIKAAFDPHNQLNPGKVATPAPGIDLIRIDEAPTRGRRDRLISLSTWNDYPDVVNCNGNGTCFNWDPHQTMCPSWKGTGERKYSPKGRASLMKEWLIQSEQQGFEPLRTGESGSRWLNVPRKIVATLRRWTGENDFSHEVYDSMDACLACKGCTTGCPVHVDVPAFRSVFFSHYFGRYLRPPRHYLIASLEWILPRASQFSTFYNGLTQRSLTRRLIGKLTGLTALPSIRQVDLQRDLAALDVAVAYPDAIRGLSEDEKKRSVILVQDVFTRCFEADLVVDICRFLGAIGYRVWLAPYTGSGKPLHVLGFLPAFRRVASRTAIGLRELSHAGVELVGIEPSMTLTYRDEYRQTLHSDAVPKVLLLQEWLATRVDRLGQYRHRFRPGHFRLLPHCSEASLAGQSMKSWQEVFASLGSSLNIEQVGCCGMAGTYGHEIKHAATSKTIYDLSWSAKVTDHDGAPCATGFSCRSQVERFSSKRMPHPIQLLLQQMTH